MKRKAIIITIIVVALIIVAVASWLIYKKYFKKPTDTDSDTDTDTDTTTPTTTPSKPTKPKPPTFTPIFTKGQKVIPRFPLLTAPAYELLTGSKIGDFKSAVVNEQINATTMYADVMITGTYGVMTQKSVKLQPKDWIKA